MLCVNYVQRRFQISDYKFFRSDTAPYESRKHSVAEIAQQITTGQKCARTDYTREGENSEALEMCIRFLLRSHSENMQADYKAKHEITIHADTQTNYKRPVESRG